MNKLFDDIKIPVVLLMFLACLEILSWIGIIPPSHIITPMISQALDKYGLIVIGPLALFENLAAFNVYFPGSIVILTTMALSAGNPPQAVGIFLIYYVFAILAYHIDFLSGKYIQSKKSYSGLWPLWLRFTVFFSHPQLASLLCVQLGGENRKYSEIIKYMLAFAFGWTLFWSIVMYSIGTLTGTNLDLKAVAYIYLFGLLAYDIYRHYRPAKAGRKESA